VNRQEIKLELDATTLRPQDASQEAVALLETDAELAAWHAKRIAFDESVVEKQDPSRILESTPSNIPTT
jgi:hypothetical protein